MTSLFLIAHKVRGEPAFDVALQLEILDEDGEPMWIIPTSGHRAYPWWYVELSKLKMYFYAQDGQWTDRFDLYIDPMPPGLPDHYPHSAEPGKAQIDILGLIPPAKPQRRF